VCVDDIMQLTSSRSKYADHSGRAVLGVSLRRSLAEIAGWNPAGSMDVCPLWVLCVVRHRSLRRADPSSRGVLPMVCVCVCVNECDHIQNNPLNLQCVGIRGQTGGEERKERKKERKRDSSVLTY